MSIRVARESDGPFLEEWLSDAEMARCFPMADSPEIQEAAKRWTEMGAQGPGLTVEYQGSPVGFGLLFLHSYKRLVHQCYFVMLVARPYQKMGVGGELLGALEDLARGKGVELVHTEILGDQEAVDFFERRGYREYCRQEWWIDDYTEKRPRILVEKFI